MSSLSLPARSTAETRPRGEDKGIGIIFDLPPDVYGAA